MTSPQPDVQPPPYPRRFTWPMRLFLTLFLAAITYRCFGVLLPLKQWRSDFEMSSYPTRLSTLPELAKMSRKAGPNDPNPIVEDSMITADSMWDYWKPWPGKETRPKVRSWTDGAKCTACWFDGRLAFLEHLAGINENWPMFSPDLDNTNYHTRARLLYDDDSELIVRQAVEPADYRHYTHWMMDRVSNYETGTDETDKERCFGYCNLLRHRYGHNAAGTKLVTIVLFQVKIIYPEPGVDAQTHYENQLALTVSPPRLPHSCRSDRARPAALIVGAASGVFGGHAVRIHAALWTPQVLPDFYEYDAVRREGRMLEKQK